MFLKNISDVFNGEIPIIIDEYLESKDKLNINELKSLKKIFEKIGYCELKSTNILFNNLIVDGLILIPKQKRNLNILDGKRINEIISSIGKITTIEDGYYYKTLISLIKNINYIDIEEQILLIFLFDQINYDNKKIDNLEGERFIIN